jgi:hypothetical protein
VEPEYVHVGKDMDVLCYIPQSGNGSFYISIIPPYLQADNSTWGCDIDPLDNNTTCLCNGTGSEQAMCDWESEKITLHISNSSEDHIGLWTCQFMDNSADFTVKKYGKNIVCITLKLIVTSGLLSFS